ncbi:hypothetical protein N7G274_008277 [Stereocaulon virgatum]|uniref:Uncharacterized protein n=1 Tax=Stereocaulon virgatum TaxID=373712 RepID=A0ABR3ZZ15_9LECA
MASLLIGVGVLSYDQIKKQKAKRAEKKAYNSARFSELERENARRINALQKNSCFCQQSDWQGGACERHGYVPAAGTLGGARRWEDVRPPAYEEGEYTNASMGDRAGGSGRGRENSGLDGSAGDDAVLLNNKPRAPVSMPEDEVARINEERRKKGAGGLKGWKLRWKAKEEGVVR